MRRGAARKTRDEVSGRRITKSRDRRAKKKKKNQLSKGLFVEKLVFDYVRVGIGPLWQNNLNKL